MGRKEQAEASRAALVAAARNCFAEHGYDATTVAAILERAGMARGALYHYFPGGKSEIFAAVFEVINDDFHRQRDAAGDEATPLARIAAGIRVFLDLCTDDAFARIALVDAPRLISGQRRRGTSYELMRAQLDEALATGEARPFDPEVMAATLYGAVRAAGELVTDAPVAERARIAVTAAETLDLLVAGLRAVT